MTAKNDALDDITRAAATLGRRPEGKDQGGYEISSALATPARRKLMGSWEVREHHVAGIPYPEVFATQQLKGIKLRDGVYQASYEFREWLCIKKVAIDGILPSEEEDLHYEYRLTVALSWRPGPGKTLVVRPEIGYQLTLIDGQPLACKDLPVSGEEIRLSWRIEEGELVLEEGDDKKLLRRVGT